MLPIETPSHDALFIQLGEWLLDCQQLRIKKDEIWIDVPTLSFNLLMALVKQPGVVLSSDQLIKAAWGKQVVSDENLQQRIRILRKMLNDDTQSPIYISTIRGKGYRLLVEPKKLIKQKTGLSLNDLKQINLSETHQFQINSKLSFNTLLATAAFIIITAISFWYWYTSHPINKQTNEGSVLFKRIAVLPFLQAEATGGLEGLEEGLTEQIIQGLSSIKDLQVIAYTSVKNYQQTNRKHDKLINELQVDGLIEAEIFYLGDMLEINLWLTDLKQDQKIWQQQYQVYRKDLVSLANRILPEIAQQLGAIYIPRRMTQDTYQEAYSLYLKGRQHYFRYNRLDNQLAINLFRQSLAASPAFALALCGLSDALSQQVHQYNGNGLIAEEALRLADAAINLQPDLAEAYKAKGFALDSFARNDEAILAYDQAILLNPSYADAILNKAVLIWEAGDYNLAYQLINQVISLDPLEVFGHLLKAEILAAVGNFKLAAPIFYQLYNHHHDNMMVVQGVAQFYFDQGNYQKAVEYSQSLVQLAPTYTPAQLLIADSLLFNGKPQQAVFYYQKLALLLDSWQADYAKLRLALIGDIEFDFVKRFPSEAESLHNTTLSLEPLDPSVDLLLVASQFPEKSQYNDKRILQGLISKDRVTISWLENDPHLQNLRKNLDYPALLSRLNSIKLRQRQQLAEIDLRN